SVGMKEADVKIKNIPGDDAGKAFLTDPKVVAVTTWNPHLFKATEGGKGKVIFSSKDIPGEIIDLLVMSSKALKESPKLGAALAYVYFSYQRHLENPMDRLMPNLGQLREGIHDVTTPDKRTETVWIFVDTVASLVRLAKGMGSGVLIAIVLGLSMGIFSTAD